MLLQPFAAAAVVAAEWTPALGAALGAMLAVFLTREPLLVLVRQRWVWREPRPETARARRWLSVELAAAAACGAYLWAVLPRAPLAALGAVAVAMTALAVRVAVRNRQRSPAFQALTSAALGSTGLLAALAATGGLPPWAWQLWGYLTLHSANAILVVHARLAARAGGARRAPRGAWSMGAAQFAAGFAVAAAAGALAAAPLVFSAAANTLECRRIGAPEPLRRVGFRTLAVSLLHTGVAMGVLWLRGAAQ